MGEEAVPVVGARDRIPGPVGGLRLREVDARLGEFLPGVAPDVEVALGAAGRRAPGALEPGVLVGGVVDDQLDDDPEAARVRRRDEGAEVVEGAVDGVDRLVVRDVVAVVPERRGIEGQQPDGGRAEVGDVVEPRGQAGEVADAVAVRIEERAHMGLVDDRLPVPTGRVLCTRRRGSRAEKPVVGHHLLRPCGRCPSRNPVRVAARWPDRGGLVALRAARSLRRPGRQEARVPPYPRRPSRSTARLKTASSTRQPIQLSPRGGCGQALGPSSCVTTASSKARSRSGWLIRPSGPNRSRSSVGFSPTARAARTAVTGGVVSFSGQPPPSRRSLAGMEGAPEQSPGGE